MSRLSAIRASKNARARRGASNTRVRETSTWRMEISHQYPARWSAGPKGSGRRCSHRWANTSMVPGCSRSQISCNAAGSSQAANPLDSSVNAIPALGGLPLGPLVAVDPDLGRVGEVGADLDERRAEVLVPQVEVVAGHPPVSLGEGELRRRRAGLPPVSGPDPLELLRHPDRRHLRPAGGRRPLQVRGHHVGLAVVLGELDPRDVVGLGEGGHRPAEPLPDLVEQRRGGNRQAQVLGHERDHLPAGLQDRHVGVEVDPVQALDVQLHMPAEDLIHRHHACAHDTLRNHPYAREDEPRHAI